MNAARLSAKFCDRYFDTMRIAFSQPPSLEALARELYEVPTRDSGEQSLQFSFLSKLVHMAHLHLPIYDSMVASFYHFIPPSRGGVEKRIAAYMKFYEFLKMEYARILTNDNLAKSIEAFRHRFNPVEYSDEKVLDSLIWGCVGFLNDHALQEGKVVYR